MERGSLRKAYKLLCSEIFLINPIYSESFSFHSCVDLPLWVPECKSHGDFESVIDFQNISLEFLISLKPFYEANIACG